MGRDKAGLVLGTSGATLAQRSAEILRSVTATAIEVGPGSSGLVSVREDPPGGGPLAATAAGWLALAARGWRHPVIVVATDLPRLDPALLSWLAAHPAPGSVVPVAGERVQPLCARYRPADLQLAVELTVSGRRSMSELLERIDPVLVAEEEWCPVAGRGVLDDVDTPEDLARVVGEE